MMPMTPMKMSRGIALPIVLIWLAVVTLLAISAAQITLQEQKAARNYRDREVAFESAEAGLHDAETDIEASPDAGLSRSAIFARDSTEGFPRQDEAPCNVRVTRYQGLCRQDAAAGALVPVWLQVDLADEQNGATVRYGQFTGHAMQTGAGALPAKAPRYLIELLRDRQAGNSTERPTYFYRITAIGFGSQIVNHVVLQSFYRKANAS